MRQLLATLLTLSLLATKTNHVNCQSNKLYIDSIKKYTKFVDTLVYSFYRQPETTIRHAISHYKCPNKVGGATLELYQDTTKIIYQLVHASTCNSSYVEKTYYFLKNKIVLIAITVEPSRLETRTEKIYKDDFLLLIKTSSKFKRKQKLDKDLQEGYELLKRIKT